MGLNGKDIQYLDNKFRETKEDTINQVSEMIDVKIMKGQKHQERDCMVRIDDKIDNKILNHEKQCKVRRNGNDNSSNNKPYNPNNRSPEDIRIGLPGYFKKVVNNPWPYILLIILLVVYIFITGGVPVVG